MADVFMYADETGNLDYEDHDGSSQYFGVGTVVFASHALAIVKGEQLRAEVAADGTSLPKGFHAKNDSYGLRKRVYATVSELAPRVDATFLRKSNAYSHVREAGQVRLFKLAWFLHFRTVASLVCQPGDRLFVVVATLGTKRRKSEFEAALHDVCVTQGPPQRHVVLCHWNCETSWGLQIADYALWSLQRSLEKGKDDFLPYIEPLLGSWNFPWAR